jgi:WD40 repeat protein
MINAVIIKKKSNLINTGVTVLFIMSTFIIIVKGFVRGVCVSPRGDYFLTCSTDQTVKKWPIQQHFSGKLSEDCGKKIYFYLLL